MSRYIMKNESNARKNRSYTKKGPGRMPHHKGNSIKPKKEK